MDIKFLYKMWKIQRPKEGMFFCLATLNPISKRWEDHFFEWPIAESKLLKFEKKYPTEKYNLYFCPTPFMHPQRKKSYVIGSKLLWADLDDATPKSCEFVPQIAWKSSDQRYASLWILDDFYPTDIIERRNKAMSYSCGADKGGWDLTQVLRLPGTLNHKYDPVQKVRTLWFKKREEYDLSKLPEHIYDNLDPSAILKDYKKKIKPSTLKLLTSKRATEGKRSEVIWKLNNELSEQGINATVRFNLLKGSVWNKFAGRNDEDSQLMREIEKVESVNVLTLDDEEKPNKESGPVIQLSTIEAEEIDWLWYPYIPKGKVTLLEGDPGLGKSWFTMGLASYISKGKRLPESKTRAKGKILLMSAEDGLGDTIRPRLDTLRANVKNIYAYSVPVFLDEDGIAEIDAEMEKIKPLLIIIDPIVAYMGSGVDLFRANETREIMSNLSRLAEKHNCAVIAVRHLTKGGKDKAIYRGVGSIDITAAARSALMVGPHPEEPEKRCICHIKSNLAPKGQTIEYSLDARNKIEPFQFEGLSDITPEDIMNANPDALKDSTSEEAEKWLKEKLRDKSVSQDQLYRDGESAGFTQKDLKKAADILQIRRIKIKGKTKWVIT